MKRFLATVVLAPIRFYQRFISPALPRRCKYYPTCSAYAVEAVLRFGVVRGAILAGWRLLRCNPLSHGGYDPVSAQTLFTDRRREQVLPGENTIAFGGPDRRLAASSGLALRPAKPAPSSLPAADPRSPSHDRTSAGEH